jgi:hypothetical protein
MAALRVKEPELGESQIFNVAVTVENGERVAAFEHTGAIVDQCGGRPDVVFVGNPDNVRQ